jgi:hypothetical protein
MKQPVPTVARPDVERIVRRDFEPEIQSAAFDILDTYHSDGSEPHRVQLAALKMANGNLHQLREWIASANLDFRDVLAAAEYPQAFSTSATLHALSPTAQREIYEADWRQYHTWLQRP